MPKFFRFPFGQNGDKNAVPDTAQPNNDVSYEEGYPNDYQLDQETDPNAKNIERNKYNQILFDITENLKDFQLGKVFPWITPAENGGVSVTYPARAKTENENLIFQAKATTTTSPSDDSSTSDWNVVQTPLESIDVMTGIQVGQLQGISELQSQITEMFSLANDRAMFLQSGVAYIEIRFSSGRVLDNDDDPSLGIILEIGKSYSGAALIQASPAERVAVHNTTDNTIDIYEKTGAPPFLWEKQTAYSVPNYSTGKIQYIAPNEFIFGGESSGNNLRRYFYDGSIVTQEGNPVPDGDAGVLAVLSSQKIICRLSDTSIQCFEYDAPDWVPIGNPRPFGGVVQSQGLTGDRFIYQIGKTVTVVYFDGINLYLRGRVDIDTDFFCMSTETLMFVGRNATPNLEPRFAIANILSTQGSFQSPAISSLGSANLPQESVNLNYGVTSLDNETTVGTAWAFAALNVIVRETGIYRVSASGYAYGSANGADLEIRLTSQDAASPETPITGSRRELLFDQFAGNNAGLRIGFATEAIVIVNEIEGIFRLQAQTNTGTMTIGARTMTAVKIGEV